MTVSTDVENEIDYWRIFTFCVIIFQSIGIRFFHGQGTLLSIVILLFYYRSYSLFVLKDYLFLIGVIIFLGLCKIVNPSFSFSSFLFQISIVISTYFFITQYRFYPNLLQKEFFLALKIFTVHAALGYLIYLLIPEFFIEIGEMNKSLYYLFFISTSEYTGFQRNTGLFWEPGVLQLAANLYLFYCIKFRKSSYQILIAGLTIVSTFSTVGLMILVINFVYFFYLKFKESALHFSHIILAFIALALFIPMLIGNANVKIGGENTSGLTRLRDFRIGIELIKEKPILGHGYFDEEYLLSKGYVNDIESNILSSEYISESGSMGGGFTNGLLGLIAWYGIPISLLAYFFFFKNKFTGNDIFERILFCSIPLISMISEPIAYTSLFLIFPLSYLILKA